MAGKSTLTARSKAAAEEPAVEEPAAEETVKPAATPAGKVQIRRFSGNISKTAAFIGMERSALHRKLKLLGMVGGREEEQAVVQ